MCVNHVWILKWVNLHCNLISVLHFPKQWEADYRCEFRTLSTSKMEFLTNFFFFCKTIHLDVWQDSEYASGLLKLLWCGYMGRLIFAKLIIAFTPNWEFFFIWMSYLEVFCYFFHFLCSNVSDSKCHKQKWCVLFFTCIKLVAQVLACARVMTRIKWRRLLYASKIKNASPRSIPKVKQHALIKEWESNIVHWKKIE